MAIKMQTPSPPIKPENEYRRILYGLIEDVRKSQGDLSLVDVNKIIDKLPKLFAGVKDYNERKFKTLLKDAIGKKKAIELYGLVNPKFVDTLLSVFLSINTGLIKSVSETTSARIMREVAKNPDGLPPLVERIASAANLSKGRARTIARTEMAKLNADMTKIKSIALGVQEYEWRTAGDERVRNDHNDCDGKTYKYGQETDADSGAEPGQDVNCRCTAIAIISDEVLGQII